MLGELAWAMSHAFPRQLRLTLSLLFFLSGACGLLYQVVWLRLAFASFGIITPVVSLVLSVFMAGLAIGSWLGGRFAARWGARVGSAAVIYGLAEFGIALGAVLVPTLLQRGEHSLLSAGAADSAPFLALSAVWITIALLPWCVLMGATFPLMMQFVRERSGSASVTSFSFLYSANLAGALFGTAATAVVLIELFGFRGTLWIGGATNLAIGVSSLVLSRSRRREGAATPNPVSRENRADASSWLSLLFATGLISMAMEVIWIRAFTPYLKTQVYSFALVLFSYLLSSAIGVWLYRRDLGRDRVHEPSRLVAYLVGAAMLPAAVNDLRWFELPNGDQIQVGATLVLLASILPFCVILGYLTPQLVDRASSGEPRAAGRAYAVNVLGCIVGPLIAGYLLLPWMNPRYAIAILAVPLFFFMRREPLRRVGVALAVGLVAFALLVTRSFEETVAGYYPGAWVFRDHVATTVAAGRGRDKLLLVNGIGMTRLTTITKFMAHLPLAHHSGTPRSVLVICFGMGTSYRSALSWSARTTAVELVPGVTKAFPFFFEDATQRLSDPNGRIVVDDGRRHLLRTDERYDVILLDPPPPLEAAGTSLLYSVEFYQLAKQRMNPGAVLQAWLPSGSPTEVAAVLTSLQRVFPSVRAFRSLEGWGAHFLASDLPLESLSTDSMLAQLPEAARRDLLEWSDGASLEQMIGAVLAGEMELSKLTSTDPRVVITDDRPLNEYFLLRRRGWRSIPP
jgi:predicted membrane-bound spermidine synthase